MSAGTHPTANNAAKPRQRMFWIFGGAATAVIAGGILMQYFRAPAGQAATNGTAGTARVSNPQRMMAKVGNEVITFEAVADECVARYGREVLDDLIHRTIITKACEAQNITVSELEVTQEIQRIAGRFKLDAGAYMSMLQSERNITEAQYRRSVIWPMLALRKLAGETVEISEEEMQKAFVRNYGPRVKARVIVLSGNTRQHDALWKKAKSDPDNFDKLAQEHSIDPNSRALGGMVPPIPRNATNDAVEKEAFKLKEGEVSPLIQIADNRLVILKCEGRTEPVVTDIEAVRDTLYDELKEAKTQQAVAKVFEDIKAKTPVENIYASAPATRGPVQASAQGAATNAVQPASTQQPRPAARPAAAPATSTAPARTNRN